ncbi:MAG: hypothetical protein M3495_00170 [Pseudomonadota bacterium]|nr:hypothetical protein [Gammaproteobacteria bacterium]MDQ3580128.1 hypothetical protein [Pseudomonadota bacterium]
MTEQSEPGAPPRESPTEWEHYQLYKDVRGAIASLPIYFRTETHISGIMATDLHTLNSVLGAAIEEQVVRTLNLIRNTWDPDEKYALCSFVRQAQTFPDVLLRKASSDQTDAEARTALGRLRQRVQEATDIPSPKAKAALAIVAELEHLLEMT